MAFLRLTALWLLLLLSLSTFTSAQVFFTQAGAGKMDGTNWANAHSGTQLRATLKAATGGTQFWLAAGTYKPDAAIRDTFFSINTGVQIYGGFKGTETALNQRDWVNNETILSGDIGKKGDSTDNSEHVVVFWYADNTTLLDGCTITGGNAKTSNGGGIYNSTRMGSTGNSTPTIRHCKITHNRAVYGGGGIYNYAYAPGNVVMTIDSCLFEYNNCDSGQIQHLGGGAIFSSAAVPSVSNELIVTNCVFQHNNTDYYGGGILMSQASATTLGTIKNCTFQYNTASNAVDRYGSGAAINFETFDDFHAFGAFNVTVDSCKFLYNSSFSYGGAIYSGLLEVGKPVLTINNSVFEGNTADNAAALFQQTFSSDQPFVENAKMFLNNDVFRLNTVGSGSAGAIDVDAAQSSIDSIFMVNCLFDRNGAMTIANRSDENGISYVSLLNTTIYDDAASAAAAGAQGIIFTEGYTLGGGGAASMATTKLTNSIIYWWPGVSTRAFYNSMNNATFCQNSLVKGCNGSGTGWNTAVGTDLGGNIDVYPGFADTANYNLALRCNSPCLDTADNPSITPYLAQKDLHGANRIYNVKADMGAYEFNAVPPHIMPVILNDTGFVITAENYSTGQEDSVEWTFGDGGSSHYYPVVHKYAAAGTYHVCLHIFSCVGNADSCFDIVVRLHTGVPKQTVLKSLIAPNPAGNELFLSRLPLNSTIELYDLAGRTVYKRDETQQTATVNTSKLPTGMYILMITDTQTGTREANKIIVQH